MRRSLLCISCFLLVVLVLSASAAEEPDVVFKEWPYGAIAWIEPSTVDKDRYAAYAGEQVERVFELLGLPVPQPLEEGSASVTPSSTNPYHCPAVRSSRLTWYGGETMPALLLVPFEDGDGIHQLLPASFKRMGGLHGMGSPRFAHAWWLRQLLGAPAWILVSVDIPWMILSHEVSHWVLRQYWRVEYGTRWTLPEFIDEGLAE